jgi:hypothetical protein
VSGFSPLDNPDRVELEMQREALAGMLWGLRQELQRAHDNNDGGQALTVETEIHETTLELAAL